MLPSTSGEALLGCPSFSPWNLPLFTLESTLSSSCSRSDPLSLAKVRLSPTLALSSLMICYSGQTALFLFLLAKTALAYLSTALSVALRPLFFISAGPVCSSFSAEAYAILHALCWSRQHQQVCHFSSLLLLSDSSSVLATLYSPPSFLLSQTSWQELSFLSLPVLSGYNGFSDTRFSRRTTWLMSWPDEERYLRPPQFVVVSLLLSLIFALLFSRTGGVLSHRSSLTHRFPRFPPRNLSSLVMLAVFSLVFAATDIAFL